MQNQIKAQAREHERFRRLCVSVAQRLHQVDMRMKVRLGRDTDAIQRQAAEEAAAAEARKHQPQHPTVKTEAEAIAEAEAIEKAKKEAIEKAKSQPLPRIRPLSEAKAVENGAKFLSEAFLFVVAGSLIIFETIRSRKKEQTRREDVADRLRELEQSEKAARQALVTLEREILELKAQQQKQSVKKMPRLLPREVWEEENAEEEKPNESESSWFAQLWRKWQQTESTESTQESKSQQPSASVVTSSPHSVIPAPVSPSMADVQPKQN